MKKIFAASSSDITQKEKDHGRLVRSLAGECMVLLENDGTLPVSPGRVALYGNGARQTVKGGTGSGNVNTRDNISIDEGLRRAGFTVTTQKWLDRSAARYAQAREDYLKNVPLRAKELGCAEINVVFSEPFQIPAPEEITEKDILDSETDTAIYVISRNSGEGSDRRCVRGDYLLFEEERRQLLRLGRAYSKLILVLNIGGVMDMGEISSLPGINAILLMGQLGSTAGLSLADVLAGKAVPSGKLTDTWAKRYEDYPSSASFGRNNGNVDDEYYTEGIYVGYRYFDTFGIEPIYPFGYGLSYTTFDVKCVGTAVSDGKIKIRVEVKNTGPYPGREVVQAYYSAPRGMIPKPYQELAGYIKTRELAPGESQTVELCWNTVDMASYCPAHGCWMLESGRYVIRVGTDSRNSRSETILMLDRTVKTSIVKNLFGDSDPVREIEAPTREEDCPPDIPAILLDAEEIQTNAVRYQGQRPRFTTNQKRLLTAQDLRDGTCTLEELVAQLAVEELAALCVGTYRSQEGSVLGNASRLIPGAAGDTSHILAQSRGIPNMVMADGPAGLRLQPVFKTDKQGNLLPGGTVLEDSCQPFDPRYDDQNSDTWYQYCTSIPIGWSLAQSWNPKLLERLGNMIGEEMVQFGIDLWLAPALNIHRNPLCGRNFEYYSEDPLISGKTAAAITRGVQAHPGKGVTIKHLAANSQEDNRYFTNAHISERAMREIYLRGFQIAIVESQPMSIMTSYNLINGVHAANHFDLLQSVCRDEWGFQGMIMTDWYTSQDVPDITGGQNAIYPISSSTGCVKAGNDIQMPGCQKNVDDIVQAVISGKPLDGYTITLEDLQHCAARVIRTALNTGI